MTKLRPESSVSRAVLSAKGYSTAILFVTGAYLLVGVLAFTVWRIGGRDAWIEDFFRIPGAFLLVFFSSIGLYFSLRVWRAFDTGEPMRRAWQLITLSAAADLTGTVLVQVFGTRSRLNPLTYTGEVRTLAPHWRDAGQMIDGTCRFAMLAVGLLVVLMIYRKAGFLGRLRAVDWGLLAIFGAYLVREALDVVVRARSGRSFSGAGVFNLPVDPLLWVLLSQALRLYRSVQRMGFGWIGKCYAAFAAGIALVLLGDVAIWATNWGYLPWPWSALGWYVWVPAAAAFAAAPAFQWEGMRAAEVGQASRPVH